MLDLEIASLYAFHRYFSCQPTLEGFKDKNIFFFSVLCGKPEKSQNTFFGYKKWLKFESDDIFKSTTYKFYFSHFLIFLLDSILVHFLPF